MMYIAIDFWSAYDVHLNYKLGHLIHVIAESGSIWFMKKVTIADSAYSKQVPLLSLSCYISHSITWP